MIALPQQAVAVNELLFQLDGLIIAKDLVEVVVKFHTRSDGPDPDPLDWHQPSPKVLWNEVSNKRYR